MDDDDDDEDAMETGVKEMGSLLPEIYVPPSPSQDHLYVAGRLTQRKVYFK